MKPDDLNPVFFTIKDLMLLVGYNYYKSAQRQHMAIRKQLGKERGHITIKEYCEFERLEFEYIWEVLRGKKNEQRSTEENS